MRSFEEWWEENYGDFSGHTKQTKRNMWIAFEAGQESLHTDVDELKQHIKRLELKLDEIGLDRQGLMGQVHAVKQLIQEYHQHSYREADDFVFYLEQALRGEQQ